MSKTDIGPSVDEVIEIASHSANGHFSCCVSNPPVFICGAPYHPECTLEENDEYGNCKKCKALREMFQCEKGHQHCPISKRNICPQKGS